MRFSNTIEIQRAPDEVFDYLATPENIPRWNYVISESQRVPAGPVRVNTRIQQHRTIPRPADEQLEVTELVPGRRLVLVGDLGSLHGTITYALEPTAGGTRLTNDAELEASGALRLVAPLATGRVRDAVAQNLATLKGILESDRA